MRLSYAVFCTYIKNFPSKYIEKSKGITPRRVYERRFGAPVEKDYRIKPENYHDTLYRPWQREALEKNEEELGKIARDEMDPAGQSYLPIEAKWKKSVTKYDDGRFPIFRGDQVELLAGRDKGKRGFVTYVVRERNVCYVQALNVKYETTQGPQQYGGGRIQIKEQPLDVSTEVALIDPATDKPTSFRWECDDQGEWHRISNASQRAIEIPISAGKTYEYPSATDYKESDKDTTVDDVREKTYKMRLSTFEQDIMEALSIKEDKTYGRTYWY